MNDTLFDPCDVIVPAPGQGLGPGHVFRLSRIAANQSRHMKTMESTPNAGLRLLSCLGVLLMLNTSLLVAAEAQKAGKGAITGTVTSKGGEPVAGATVIAFNLDTGDSLDTQTDVKGTYRIQGLAKGDYEISVAGDGYDMYSSPEIKTDGKSEVRHNVKLEPLPQAGQ